MLKIYHFALAEIILVHATGIVKDVFFFVFIIPIFWLYQLHMHTYTCIHICILIFKIMSPYFRSRSRIKRYFQRVFYEQISSVIGYLMVDRDPV